MILLLSNQKKFGILYRKAWKRCIIFIEKLVGWFKPSHFRRLQYETIDFSESDILMRCLFSGGRHISCVIHLKGGHGNHNGNNWCNICQHVRKWISVAFSTWPDDKPCFVLIKLHNEGINLYFVLTRIEGLGIFFIKRISALKWQQYCYCRH